MQTLEKVAQILNQAVVVSRAEVKRVFTKEKNERRLWAYYNQREQVTVRNGFPVLVWFQVYGPEPEVGYNDEWLSNAEITTTSFNSVKFLNLTDKEQDEAIDQAFDTYLSKR